MRKEIFYSVKLDEDKCKGCINCMKRCPTEAIRVRDGKAKISYDKCIGCGECIRICTHRAKHAVYDSFDITKNFKYKVALPAPSLYGQFNNLDNINIVLAGLLKIGFDAVFEVSRAAELVSEHTRNLFEEGKVKKPAISSACPAIVELILLRFHDLKDNLLNIAAPVDVAARLAREEAVEKTGLKPEEIGVFFISPCAAKVKALKEGLGFDECLVDGVLSVSDVYFRLVPEMPKIEDAEGLLRSGVLGISWATSGGEAAGVFKEKNLSADGIENCISILKELEDEKLKNVDFVELNACPGGCVGGILNIENPFVAKTKILNLRKYLPITRNKIESTKKEEEYFDWQDIPTERDSFILDADRGIALKKMQQIQNILNGLPKLDCGNCGAPSCTAFAEDVVNEIVDQKDCNRQDGK